MPGITLEREQHHAVQQLRVRDPAALEQAELRPGEVALIKGSRELRMERIVSALAGPATGSWPGSAA